jgi:hypothetical protein
MSDTPNPGHNYPKALFDETSFSRVDEGEDAIFYNLDRFVPHLDSLAL